MHRRNNHIRQGRIVAQEKCEGLLSAHPLPSLRTSSLIKKIMRSMVATFIMARWEAEDAKAKGGRKDAGADASRHSWGAAREKPVRLGSSQESSAGTPCGSWASGSLLRSWVTF